MISEQLNESRKQAPGREGQGRAHLGHFGRRQVLGELLGGPAHDAGRVARPVVLGHTRLGLDAGREHLDGREAFDLRAERRARALHDTSTTATQQHQWQQRARIRTP